MNRIFQIRNNRILFCLLAILALPQISFGQGSIFGQVKNIDLSIPANNEVSFIGFINDSDFEIRIEIVDGAGFDNGNWFDDFQNYLSEAAGIQYDYLFYNKTLGTGFHLSGIIPNNSFQQEDVLFEFVNWDSSPVLTSGFFKSDSSLQINWEENTNLTFHIYRRQNIATGSFYRIDDPSGSLSNPGVSGNFFIDETVDSSQVYDYLIIGEDALGEFTSHSQIISVVYTSSCCDLRGDINNSLAVDISDLTYLVNYMFKSGPAISCEEKADLDLSGSIDISDLTFIVNYFFKDGPQLPDCNL